MALPADEQQRLRARLTELQKERDEYLALLKKPDSNEDPRYPDRLKAEIDRIAELLK